MYESPWDSVQLSVRQQWTHASCKLKPKLPHMCSALSSNAQPKQACFLRHRERPQVLFWARLTLLWILFHHALNRGSLLTGQPWVVYVLPQRQAANTLHVALIRMRRMLADKYQLLAAFKCSPNKLGINMTRATPKQSWDPHLRGDNYTEGCCWLIFTPADCFIKQIHHSIWFGRPLWLRGERLPCSSAGLMK